MANSTYTDLMANAFIRACHRARDLEIKTVLEHNEHVLEHAKKGSNYSQLVELIGEELALTVLYRRGYGPALPEGSMLLRSLKDLGWQNPPSRDGYPDAVGLTETLIRAACATTIAKYWNPLYPPTVALMAGLKAAQTMDDCVSVGELFAEALR